jgi:hypothetical protein
MRRSLSKEKSHKISQQTEAIDLYSASAEDRETVCYFFDFQEMRESIRNTQYPVINLLVSK